MWFNFTILIIMAGFGFDNDNFSLSGLTQEAHDNVTVISSDDENYDGLLEIALTKYVKDYKAAGKAWLDTIVEQKEQAYDTLYDKLQQLGDPHIPHFNQANREQVFKCIRDRTGRFLSEDEFVVFVEREEEKKKPKYKLTGDAREALKDYSYTGHTLCEAQENFASSTKVLEEKIEDKSIFLDIIQQVQLPAVQVQISEGSAPTHKNKPERWLHTSTLFYTNRLPA